MAMTTFCVSPIALLMVLVTEVALATDSRSGRSSTESICRTVLPGPSLSHSEPSGSGSHLTICAEYSSALDL